MTDTALMLQMQAGLRLLEGDLLGVCARCATLAEGHRATLMAGRTLLQQAVPTLPLTSHPSPFLTPNATASGDH